LLKIHEIREIIKLVDESNLAEIEVKAEDARIYLKRSNVAGAAELPLTATIVPKPAAAPVAVPEAPIAAKPAAVVEHKPAPTETKPAAQTSASKIVDESLHKIVSPMVGTFYRAPEEGAAPYVKPGDQVQKSTVVCIVEAMKLFNEIEAEVNGEIVEVLVENGQLVEHGQPLFLVKTV